MINKLSTKNFSLILIASLFMVFACKTGKNTTKSKTKTTKTSSNQKKKQSTLVSFKNGEKVYQDEFERVYQKNNGGYEKAKTHTAEQFQEYLDLYINFKRKVMEAEKQGLDTMPAFVKEFSMYKNQLAKPYLLEKEVLDSLVAEAFERSKYVLNASHLLIRVNQNAKPKDTLKAYNLIISYRDSIINGADFEIMAEKLSQDPSAKKNKGNLGFFTVFEMVYPFETAAYETKVGEVSMPIRTKFGYHLLKVNDKKENKGKVKTSHIVIRVGQGFSATSDKDAAVKIEEIYKKLEAGEDFEKLAEELSDDKLSAKNGGDLGFTRLIPQMEEEKMKLNKGEYSKPFKTPFGYHILKVTSVIEPKSFEEMKKELKSKVTNPNDVRAQLSKQNLINRIEKEYGLTMNETNWNEFIGALDKDFISYKWRIDSMDSKFKDMELLTIGTDPAKAYTLAHFADAKQKGKFKSKGNDVKTLANDFLKEFKGFALINYEEDRLPEKYPEFKHLIQEYRDGILLFALTEKEVWKKAMQDTVGLKKFFQEHKTEFKHGERLKIVEFISSDKSAIEKVDKMLSKGKSPIEVDTMLNKGNFKVILVKKTIEKGVDSNNEILFTKPAGYHSPITKDSKTGKFTVIYVEKFEVPGNKTFKEAKSECITKYQNELEKNWLKYLEETYPASISQSTFKKLFK